MSRTIRRYLDTGKLFLIGQQTVTARSVVFMIIVQNLWCAVVLGKDRWRHLSCVADITVGAAVGIACLRMRLVASKSLGAI